MRMRNLKPISLFAEPTPNRRAENTKDTNRCNDELGAHVLRLEAELQIVKKNYAIEVDIYIQEMVRLTENLKAQEQRLKDAADTLAKASAEANRRVVTCKRLLQRMLRQNLARAWACFKESIWTSKRNNAAVHRVLKRMSHRSLALAFEGYSESVSTMVSQRMRVKRMLHQQLASAWTLFSESVMHSKGNRETIHTVLKRMSHRSLTLAFECYVAAVDVIVRQRNTMAKVIAQLRSQWLIKAFDAWVAYVIETKDEHAEEANILAKQLLKDVASAQQAKASEQANRRIHACKRVVQRILRLHLASAWSFFKESICASKRGRETVDKVLKRMSHRSLALAFEGYSGAVCTKVWQRRRAAKAIAQWILPCLTKAFEAWVECVDVTRQEQAEESQKLAQTRLMADADLRGKGTPTRHSLASCIAPGVGTSVIEAQYRHRDICIILMILMILMLLALAALAGFAACAENHVTCQQHVLHVPCKERASEGWRESLLGTILHAEGVAHELVRELHPPLSGTILHAKGEASLGDAAHELEVLQDFDAQSLQSEVRSLQSQLQTSEKDYLAAHEQLEKELLACHHRAHRDESEVWALHRPLQIIDKDFLAPHEQIENELQACHHRLRGQEQVALYKRPEPLNPKASSLEPKQLIEPKAQHEDVVAQLESELQATKEQLSTTLDNWGRSQEEVAQLTETKAQHEEMIAQLEGQLHATKEQLSKTQTDLSQTQDELEHTTRDLQEELSGKAESIGGLQGQLARTQSKLHVSKRELRVLGFSLVSVPRTLEAVQGVGRENRLFATEQRETFVLFSLEP